MTAHLLDQFDGNRTAIHGCEEQGHAFGFFSTVRYRGGAREDEDTVRLLGITAPYLTTVDHPLVTVAHGGGLELGSVAAHVRLSDGERQLHLTARDFGQITLFHRLTPILDN